MPCYRVKISIPAVIDRLLSWPVLLGRRLWYGYAFRRIPLANIKEYTIVDAEDFHTLSQYVWLAERMGKRFRATRVPPGKTLRQPVPMHRQIMASKLNVTPKTLPADKVVDHIDRNSLNNTRTNLRLATFGQNSMNRSRIKGTSKYKGVYYVKEEQHWRTSISVNRKKIHLGRFKKEEDAARAYDKAAKKYHGEFANLNFPPPPKAKGLKHIIKKLFNSKIG